MGAGDLSPGAPGSSGGRHAAAPCLSGKLALLVDDAELEGRRAAWTPPPPRYQRGYGAIFAQQVTQADEGTLPLEELLNWLDRSQERIATTLSKMDEAALAREHTSGDRKTTVGQRAFFLYSQETYHVGQTELFRQLAGKDDKII